MYQVLGPRVLVALAAWLALSIFILAGAFGVLLSLQAIVAIVDVLILTILTSNYCWRFIWNWTGPLGRWLSRLIYPDLNGTYDVVIESNWPIVKKMLDASRTKGKLFDPFSLDRPNVDLLELKLEAKIKQTWFAISMSIYSNDDEAVIGRSKTLATIPAKIGVEGEKVLIYIFEQENKSRPPTDDPYHEGTGLLRIDPGNHRILIGEYWNNRAWHRGINTAGKIRLTRRDN